MSEKKLRIVFFGTPFVAVPFFEALVDAQDTQIVGVVTQAAKPVGRSSERHPSAIARAAAGHTVSIYTPATLRSSEMQVTLASLEADLFVVVAYGKLLPKAVFELPRLGTMNVHFSLLPRWRGAAPVQAAIAAGDAETGLTIFLLDEGLDTGPILAQRPIKISADDTSESIFETCLQVGPEILLKTIRSFAGGSLSPKMQPNEGVTLAPKLTREDGRIDWSRPAQELERKVRAYYPWPGTWTMWGGRRVKILQSRLADQPLSRLGVGQVLIDGECVFVQSGDGMLELIKLQLEGASVMTAAEFVRGYGARIAGSTLG